MRTTDEPPIRADDFRIWPYVFLDDWLPGEGVGAAALNTEILLEVSERTIRFFHDGASLIQLKMRANRQA